MSAHQAAFAAALRACELTAARLAQELAHLRALSQYAPATEGMAAQTPPAPAPAPKPSPAHRDRGAHTWQLGDETLTLIELAARAGCAPESMRQRLKRGISPADAVAGGARMAWGTCRKTPSGEVRRVNSPGRLAKPDLAPRFTSFNPDLRDQQHPAQLSATAEVVNPNNVQPVVLE